MVHRLGNRRLWRRLARAPEAVARHPEGRPLPGSAELPGAARRTPTEEAQEPSWGAAEGGAVTMRRHSPAAADQALSRWAGLQGA